MGSKCKDNQNHSPSLMLLYCWIRGTSMGKVGLCTPNESRIESGMSSHYWMSRANKRRELVFARGNFPSWNHKKCMCKSGKNQTGRERETQHTPARSRLKSRINFHTSVQPVHFPAKVVRVNEWKRRLEEKAHAGLVRGPVRGSSHGAWQRLATLEMHEQTRTGYTCSREQRKKWGYFNGDTCECGLAADSTSNMLQC